MATSDLPISGASPALSTGGVESSAPASLPPALAALVRKQQENVAGVAAMADRIRLLESQLKVAGGASDPLKDLKIEQLEKRIAELEGDLQTVKDDLAAREAEIEDLQGQPVLDEATATELESLRGKTKEQSKRIGDLNGALLQAQQDIARLREQHSYIQKCDEELETANRELIEALAQEKKKTADVQEELQAAQAKIDGFDDAQDQKKARAVETLEKSLAAAQRQIEALSSENSELEDAVRKKNLDLRKADKTLSEAREKHDALVGQLIQDAPELFKENVVTPTVEDLLRATETHSLQPKERPAQMQQLQEQRDRTAQENAQLKAELAYMQAMFQQFVQLQRQAHPAEDGVDGSIHQHLLQAEESAKMVRAEELAALAAAASTESEAEPLAVATSSTASLDDGTAQLSTPSSPAHEPASPEEELPVVELSIEQLKALQIDGYTFFVVESAGEEQNLVTLKTLSEEIQGAEGEERDQLLETTAPLLAAAFEKGLSANFTQKDQELQIERPILEAALFFAAMGKPVCLSSENMLIMVTPAEVQE